MSIILPIPIVFEILYQSGISTVPAGTGTVTVVSWVSFLWHLLEPYKFLTTKKIRYGRAYGTIYTERDVKSISVKGSAFYDEFF